MADERQPRSFQTHDYDETKGHPDDPAPIPISIRHGDDIDVLQGSHLHFLREDGALEEHTIEISERNPADCTGSHSPDAAELGHEPGHRHGQDCDHPQVPHGGHMDYLVNGCLHFVHGDHCDEYGPVEVVTG